MKSVKPNQDAAAEKQQVVFSCFPTTPLIGISVFLSHKQRSEILKGYSSFTEVQC